MEALTASAVCSVLRGEWTQKESVLVTFQIAKLYGISKKQVNNFSAMPSFEQGSRGFIKNKGCKFMSEVKWTVRVDNE